MVHSSDPAFWNDVDDMVMSVEQIDIHEILVVDVICIRCSNTNSYNSTRETCSHVTNAAWPKFRKFDRVFWLRRPDFKFVLGKLFFRYLIRFQRMQIWFFDIVIIPDPDVWALPCSFKSVVMLIFTICLKVGLSLTVCIIGNILGRIDSRGKPQSIRH